MVKNNLKIMKYIESHIQEAQRTASEINDKQTPPRDTLVKLLKMKERKSQRQKNNGHISYREQR